MRRSMLVLAVLSLTLAATGGSAAALADPATVTTPAPRATPHHVAPPKPDAARPRQTLAQRRAQIDKSQADGTAVRDHFVVSPKKRAMPRKPVPPRVAPPTGSARAQTVGPAPRPLAPSTSRAVSKTLPIFNIEVGHYSAPGHTTWGAFWNFDALACGCLPTFYITIYRASDNAATADADYDFHCSISSMEDFCVFEGFDGQIQGGVQYYGVITAYDNSSPPAQVGSATTPNNDALAVPGMPALMAGLCACLFEHSGGDPVNLATGALTESVTDMTVPGAGKPFELTRHYWSAKTSAGLFGPGWSSELESSLRVTTGKVAVLDDDGAEIDFAANADGSFTAPGGIHRTLTRSGGSYLLTLQDNSTRVYDSSGRLAGLADKTGQGLTLSYMNGALSSAVDAAGRVVTFTVLGGLLTKVTLADGRHVDYGYTGGLLTSVTDVLGHPTTYGYDGGNRLATITDANQNLISHNTYDPSGRVIEQVDASGKHTTFSWRALSHGQVETDMTDPTGGVWSQIYSAGVVTDTYDAERDHVRTNYDQGLNAVQRTDANFHTPTFTYDDRGNVLTETAPAPLSYLQKWSYNANNTVKDYTDGRGNVTRYEYDPAHPSLVSKMTAPEGGVTTYTYYADGQLKTVTSPRGNVDGADPARYTTTYVYDNYGNPASVTSPEGHKTSWLYDSLGRMLSQTDPRGNEPGANPADYTTTYTYDDANHVKTVTDPLGHVTHYDYDNNGNQKKVTDPLDHATITEYDAANRPHKVTDPLGHFTVYGYDDNGNLAQVTDPKGGITTYGYDGANRRTSMVSPRGNASGANKADYTTTYGYDDNGNQTTVTDPAGKTTRTDYDALNRPYLVTDPLGHQTRTDYDGNSNVIGVTDPLNHKTAKEYDGDNRLKTVTTPSGDVTTTGYDADGNQISQTTQLGFVTRWGYDRDDRQTSMVDPRGNVSGVDPAKFTWTYGYDAAGNQDSVTDPLQHTGRTGYDADNRKVSVTDADNRQTVYGYDPAGRLATVTAPDSGLTTYGYDDADRLTSRIDDNKHQTLFGYDDDNRQTSVTDPLGHQVVYGYDADGNQTTILNARGQTTTRGYDGRNLLSSVTYTDGTPSVTYGYDDAGRRNSITDSTGTRVLGYNDANELTSVTLGGSGFSYDYDPDGHLISRTYPAPSGAATTYHYNDDGQMDTATTGGTSTQFGYDPAGNLSTVTLPAGNGYSETRGYDPAGQLASVSNKKAGATLSSYTVTRDPAGLPRQIDISRAGVTTGPELFGYDASGRLASECASTPGTSDCPDGSAKTVYAYDKVGNRLTQTVTGSSQAGVTTYHYNDADQLTSSDSPTGTTTYGYDLDGNRTSAGAAAYTYNAANQLTAATTAAGSFTYSYDDAGNRIDARQAGNGTLVSHNLWDTNNTLPLLAAQTEAGGALTASYQYGPNDVPVSETTPAGTFYYHHDWQDSTSDITDSAGTPQWRYTYTAYGTTTAAGLTTTAPANPLQYNGQVNDPTTGLYDLRARNYDSAFGQFTSTDPLAADNTTPYTSPYTYADDQPTVETDPSGQCGWIPGTGKSDCWDTVGGILGAPYGINPVTSAKQAFNQCVEGIIFGSHHGEGAGPGCLNEFTGVHEFERGVINQCLDQMKLGLGQMALLAAGGWELAATENELLATVGSLDVGGLTVTAEEPSSSELAVAWRLARQGHKVLLRDPLNIHGERTSDMLVDGEPWDTYTPDAATQLKAILSRAAGKARQARVVVIDLRYSQYSVGSLDQAEVTARIRGLLKSWNKQNGTNWSLRGVVLMDSRGG